MSDPNAGTGQGNTGAGVQQGAEGQPQGTGAGEGAGQNPQGQQGTQQTTEVSYEFKPPEGVEFDQARLDQFTSIAKELKLPQDAAQKLVDLEVARIKANAEAHTKMVNDWAESVKTDKDIGGDKLAENLAIAKKAIDLGPPELKDLLNETGIGNHPAVVKWALAIGKKLSEDTFVQASAAATGRDNSEQARAARMYPTTAQA